MDFKLTFYPIYLRYDIRVALPLMVTELGNKSISRQEDPKFPSGKFSYSWEGNDFMGMPVLNL